MTVEYFINFLNKLKPTPEEIIASLDGVDDQELVEELVEMYAFEVSEVCQDYGSEILNVLYNSNVKEKGLADFSFVSTEEGCFAYSHDDDNFLLDESKVFLMRDDLRSLISDSETDFIWGLIYSFKANCDFAFRKSDFDQEKIVGDLVLRTDAQNAEYFVDRIRYSYSDDS